MIITFNVKAMKLGLLAPQHFGGAKAWKDCQPPCHSGTGPRYILRHTRPGPVFLSRLWLLSPFFASCSDGHRVVIEPKHLGLALWDLSLAGYEVPQVTPFPTTPDPVEPHTGPMFRLGSGWLALALWSGFTVSCRL